MSDSQISNETANSNANPLLNDSPSKKDITKNIDKKALEEEYEYYDEDESPNNS